MRPMMIPVLVLASIATAGAQPKPAVPVQKAMSQAEATTSTLTKLEESWATALVRRDRATFERLLAPKFIYSQDASTMTRVEFLRATLGGADTVTEARNDSMVVHIFGNTGVVTGWLITKGRGKDGPFDRRYRFTDVWMPRSGTWQIVAAHDYLVPAKK
jgi:ketosteroid isomerase-like protein